jgi:choline dehydrogenase
VRVREGAPRPDLQFHFLPVGSRQTSFDDEVFRASGHAFSLLPTLLYPKSRGAIRLRGADPTEAPAIDPRYFDDPSDCDLLVEGVRMARRIARSKVLARCTGEPLTPLARDDDDDAVRSSLRRTCNTLFHPVGTCAMGPGADAVVDAELRVRGITALRVVDASIMPSIVGGNTNAPTIMIAEKGADLIRGARG